MSSSVTTFLSEQQRRSSGELATEWAELEDLYSKKLWHQLTLKVLKFVKNPALATGDTLIQIYKNFIADFEHRVNPLALVEIILYVVDRIQDPQEAIQFIEKIREKVKGNEEAVALCLTAVGNIHIKQRNLDAAKKIIEEATGILDNFDGITTVHSRFYDLTSNYHKLMGNHAEYYREALRYLGCTTLDDVPENLKTERAFNLALAALLGENIYNFGELLAHPILNSLKTPDRQWLVDFLYAFNAGNLNKFEALKPQWAKQPDLAAKEISLRQKICLLCLMEMTFKRPANHRQLTFDEIANETKLPLTEVELLVMKALSLGLVKGSIDQVEQKVHMTWVQPRVLDVDQISTMKTKLDQWCQDVTSMEVLVENKAHDILT
ncbi:26S proteasome non-ATPase regulatory subunit 13 [Lingula anatina]|uniref:26S proteasome non-ATPase regulatory subunit 13 n=1 Tax=Lingula anatina TaxID=7574 RepID=A0A1S3JUL4_LINAN|nr:26S proteasome non-ATPase regulatory subunit 13 [Lingula anatina]|eukprot:XP_013414012.1 26S proteasome non-ATPase regulatory subunit 13 [Lingula anatina]